MRGRCNNGLAEGFYTQKRWKWKKKHRDATESDEEEYLITRREEHSHEMHKHYRWLEDVWRCFTCVTSALILLPALPRHHLPSHSIILCAGSSTSLSPLTFPLQKSHSSLHLSFPCQFDPIHLITINSPPRRHLSSRSLVSLSSAHFNHRFQ